MGFAAGLVFALLLFLAILVAVEMMVIYCDDGIRLFLVAGMIFLFFIVVTICEYLNDKEV